MDFNPLVAAAGTTGQDSGVDTECDLESNDSSMSSVSVNAGAPANPNVGPAEEAPVPEADDPVPGPSGIQNVSAAPAVAGAFQIPLPNVASAPNSAASSMSGSNPVTPEPSPQQALAVALLPPTAAVMFPPPSVTEVMSGTSSFC